MGVQKARKIARLFHLPIVGVHHMEAHALVARFSLNDSFIYYKYHCVAFYVSSRNKIKCGE